ncbi:MAG: hypothetical protein ABIY39_03645 [Sphingomonas sp.]
MTFAYHRSLSPMLAVLLGLAVTEMLVVHLVVVAAWGWLAALVFGIIDLSLVVTLVGLIRSFRRLPVLIRDGRLTMRAGWLKMVTIEIDQIAGFRPQWDAAAIRQRDLLNLALLAWPNVVLDLKQPIPLGRRRISAIAHKLDEPATFHAALAALRQGDD